MTFEQTNEYRMILGVDGKEHQQVIVDTNDTKDLQANFAFPISHVRYKPNTPINLFVDMDGTLVHFRQNGEKYIDLNGEERYFHLDDIYEVGYYHPDCLKPEKNVLNAIKLLAKDSVFSIYVLSAVEPRSATAYIDKNRWLDKYLPEVGSNHRVFMPCGSKKLDYVNLTNGVLNVLLDDYTRNLKEWTSNSTSNIGVKILNGINDTHKSWQGDRIQGSISPETIASSLTAIAQREIDKRNILLR